MSNVTPLGPTGEPAATPEPGPAPTVVNRASALLWGLFFLILIACTSVLAVSAFLWVIVAIWTSIQRMAGAG